MVHSNVERFLALGADASPAELGPLLAPDVRWHEAGNPEVIVGRDAVVARMAGLSDAQPDITFDCVLADDENLVFAGRARFRRGEDEVSYRFVEHHTLVDGVVTERRAYMDAVPPDVAAFFGA